MFHAAKGTNVDVFKAVVEAVNRNGAGPTNGQGPTNSLNGLHDPWLVVRNTQVPSMPGLEKNRAVVCGKTVLVDGKGNTVLHVACRWACPDIVKEILKEVEQQEEDFVQEFLRVHDNTGRTPLMQALRHDDGGSCGGKDKVDLLLESLKCGPETRTSFEELDLFTQPANRHDSTALIHAAHGGPKRLDQVQEKIFALAKSSQHHTYSHLWEEDGGVNLDFALGIQRMKYDDKISRYGSLLAAAASGGHFRVLEDIVDAIKVS